ncbi:MAG: hypothetical protein M1833_001568 [Piccolia ochrophora]|nr:MAG: hypothetical protein M1833_001568 [Piccolia ochrophora]
MSTKPNSDSHLPGSHYLKNHSLSPRGRDLEADVDARLDSLSKNTLPREPYVLTVPSSVPYRISASQADNWRRGCGQIFDPDEEQLQYMSFLSREWEDTLIVPRPLWEFKTQAQNEANPPQQTRSGTATPVNGKPKKISLTDYKNKVRAGTPAINPTLNIADQGKMEELSKGGKANGVAARENPLPKQQAQPLRGEKRSSDAFDRETTTKSAVQDRPVEKKPRTSSPLRKPANTKPFKSTNKQQPPPAPKYELPPYLSPTLPPEVEQQLAQLEKLPPPQEDKNGQRKTQSLASSSSDVKATSNPPVKPDQRVQTIAPTAKPKSTEKPQGEGKQRPLSSDAKPISAAPEHRTKVTKPQPTGAKTSFFDSLRNGQQQKSPAIAPTSVPKVLKPKKGEGVVKLKYGRGLRKTVQRLLNMKPQPKKEPEPRDSASLRTKGLEKLTKDVPKPAEAQRDAEGRAHGEKATKRVDDDKDKSKGNPKDKEVRNGAAQQSEKTIIGKVGEKRPRAADDDRSRDPPIKRQKPESLDTSIRPRTPIPPAFKSPALSNPASAQKSRGSTPMKDVKSVVMRRVDSSEANARTPQGARSDIHEPPSSAEKTNEHRQPPADGKNKELEAWREENKKYSDMGRKIKHAAQGVLNAKAESEAAEKKAAQKGAVMALESVLCYILAFQAGNECRRLQRLQAEINNWRSLMPFLEFVEHKCRPFTHLHGLCNQIGAVCREVIHALDMERLQSEPLPDVPATPRTEEAAPPTPGGNNATDSLTSEKETKVAAQRREYLKWKSDVVVNDQALRYLWVNGLALLPVKELQSSFPRSWAKASQVPAAKAKESLIAGKYQGGYYLPLGSVTTPVEAVRAGMTLLGEWCKNESVEWRSHLTLG